MVFLSFFSILGSSVRQSWGRQMFPFLKHAQWISTFFLNPPLIIIIFMITPPDLWVKWLWTSSIILDLWHTSLLLQTVLCCCFSIVLVICSGFHLFRDADTCPSSPSLNYQLKAFPRATRTGICDMKLHWHCCWVSKIGNLLV